MSGFKPGDRVSFQFGSDPDCRYEGVLSDWQGYLQVCKEDFTHKPAGGPEPDTWLIFRPHGEPAAMISNVHHTAPQEGSTMTIVPLREGDRITYRYETDDAGEFRTSDPLTAKDDSLYDPKHGFYITYASGRTADGIHDVTLVERHGLPVEVREIDGSGVCVIYTTLQDTDGMYFMQPEQGGIDSRPYASIADRLCLTEGHPLRDDKSEWDWVTASQLSDAGADPSQWQAPLRYGNDGPTGDEDVDEASAALQARIAELEAALTAEREERKREMLDYKAQVKAMARRVGADQGWCIPGQNEVLADLGIETRVKSRVSVALEFDMVAFTDNEDPTRSFAQDSLYQHRSMGEVVAALRELIDLDSDWEDVVFDESSINFRVTDVEEEQ